ncbi:MAG TPA: site-2 protease family protein [Anaerolineae bacterium]|nr:site-2 protease family protein [Anaerolineae bacterium]
MGFLNIEELLYRIPALLIAVTVHEFMHGMTASIFGDTTAKEQGRLSLNPIKHLDPVGTLMIIIAGFGWAKPVPVNPYRFKKPGKHMMLVGLAGPLANFATAFILAKFFYLPLPHSIATLLMVTVWINVMLGIFNLLPIPPLDGSKIIPYFLPSRMQQPWYRFEQYGFVILLLLIVMVPGFFNTVLGRPIEFMLRLIFTGVPVPYNI